MEKKIKRKYASTVEAEMREHTKEELKDAVHTIQQQGEAWVLGSIDRELIGTYVFQKGLHGTGNSPLGKFKDLFEELLQEIGVDGMSLPIIQKIRVCNPLPFYSLCTTYMQQYPNSFAESGIARECHQKDYDEDCNGT